MLIHVDAGTSAPLSMEPDVDCNGMEDAARLPMQTLRRAQAFRDQIYKLYVAEKARENHAYVSGSDAAWAEPRDDRRIEAYERKHREAEARMDAQDHQRHQAFLASMPPSERPAVQWVIQPLTCTPAAAPAWARNAPKPARQPLKPKEFLWSLITKDDYPPSARQARQQGTTWVALDVDTNGRVTRCLVLESSKVPALDAQTCRLLQSRARFTPATDDSGKPVPSRTTFQQTWWLPK
jgi:TonB family protein